MELEEKIRSVVNEILDSIKDKKMRDLVKSKTFLTGGCFKALFHNEEVNDYDFYFVDEKSIKLFEKLIHDGLCKPRTKAFTDIKKFYLKDLKHKSEFAITFMLNKTIKVQFITKYFGSPTKVTNNFDFEHVKNYYVPALDVFNINYDVLSSKELIFNVGASHPINALKRMQKFIKQGWTINDPEIMKIAESINNLDLDSPGEYKEQSSGMYLYTESIMRGYNSKRSVG